MISKQAAERFLASNWLGEMDQGSRKAILTFLDEHRARMGAILLDDKRSNDRIFFLLEGELVVIRNGETLASIIAPTMFGLTTFFRAVPPYYMARATTALWYLTLDRAAHERLREENPRVAEQLALAAVHILSDRLETIDRRISDQLKQGSSAGRSDTEWSSFRARLFEESAI
jgi:CRP-like cAMP-binding protein